MNNERTGSFVNRESIWDYPEQPAMEPTHRHVQVYFDGQIIADSRRAIRVLEKGHPPVYYIPQEDVALNVLEPSDQTTYCEWKGEARYFHLDDGDAHSPNAAWTYPEPTSVYESLAGFIAFYVGRVDACYVDGEKVRPEAGDFYGGWITDEIVGPFSGGAQGSGIL